MKRRVPILVCALVLVPTLGLAQALTSLASVRVGYLTRKNTGQPQGELKAQIDALDAQIAEATRLGRSGELRRLFARGITLLSGRAWTAELDYANSLVLRTDHVIADSAKPYEARLEQMYLPAIDLQQTLTAHVALRTRPTAGPAGAPPPPGRWSGILARSTGSAAICANRPSASSSTCTTSPTAGTN
jgi:hypothetical protein